MTGKRYVWALVSLATAIVCAGAVIAPVAVAGASSRGGSAKSEPFVVTKITPGHVFMVPNGAHKNVTIRWSGKAEFPITVYVVPAYHCGSSVFTCSTGATVFKHGTHTLVLKGADSCSGTLTTPVTFVEYWYLVNAKGQYSSALPETFTCKYTATAVASRERPSGGGV
jgi:hypothetical protein